MAKLAAEKEEELRGSVSLRGRPARKVRLLMEREGNTLSAVIRRLVSKGLESEGMKVDEEEEWV